MTFLSAFDDLYERNIIKISKNKEDSIFYCSNEKESVLIDMYIFKTAERYIYIFSSVNCPELEKVFNDAKCIAIIRNFLDVVERKLCIIIDNCSDVSMIQTNIKDLILKYSSQVSVYLSFAHFTYKDKSAHFVVSDDKTFKLVTDNGRDLSFGNFNSQSNARCLKEAFEKIKNRKSTYKYYAKSET